MRRQVWTETDEPGRARWGSDGHGFQEGKKGEEGKEDPSAGSKSCRVPGWGLVGGVRRKALNSGRRKGKVRCSSVIILTRGP